MLYQFESTATFIDPGIAIDDTVGSDLALIGIKLFALSEQTLIGVNQDPMSKPVVCEAGHPALAAYQREPS
ncbi:MAG: hypothetical protein KJ587_14205 [Alphaproteobacteria bacterium]|nr:hypothetical protein [Alphaproteobacteria bacterium]